MKSGFHRFCWFALLLLAITAPVVGQSTGNESARQAGTTTKTPEWQIAAGGKMAFDVASVKVNKSGQEEIHANFRLTLGPDFAAVGNLFSVTNSPIRTLIGFAYKLSVGQTRFLMSGLPSWVDSERFDIEARAPISNPTKDQFRLMMQSLLADRFKLAMHDDMRKLPLFELVLAKPGKTGPQLTPHIDDVKCGAEGKPDARPEPAALSPFPCGSIEIGVPSDIAGRIKGGGRDISLDYIAAFLTGTAYQGMTSDRAVVNRTGLNGKYDFWMELSPQFNTPVQPETPPDPNGPTFLEALREQLGLKLLATTGLVDVMVIDHIEEPSLN